MHRQFSFSVLSFSGCCRRGRRNGVQRRQKCQ